MKTITAAKMPQASSTWKQFLLPVLLVSLVCGAYWLKVRPSSALTHVVGRESTDTLLALGISLHNAKQYDDALAAYKRVLQLDPIHPQAHYNLARICIV